MDEQNTQMKRGEPQGLDEARKAKVTDLCNMVKEDLDKWDYAFKRMKSWRRFARGLQWPGMTEKDLADPDRKYVANITMRHLKQRTSSIYAKNPTYQWRRSKRLHFRVWDGTAMQLQMAMQMAGTEMDMTGFYTQIMQEAAEYQASSTAIQRVGDTLTGLYEYFVREQIPPAKKMMKKQVLASLTDGVSYIKQSFQRATDYPPDTARALEDSMAKLARLERLSADLADNEFDENDAQMEELRVMISDLESQRTVILREGLALDYPDSTNLIPDKNMTYLPGFIGCGHVTEQFCLTPDQIKEVYGIDVTNNYTAYRENESKPHDGTTDDKDVVTARVWEIWDKASGMVYTVCDGYPDYLVEPHSPTTYTERFYPWFVYAPNAVEDTEDPFPPSDVELIMPMQMEINRSGQALADHRYAARPGHVTGANVPDEDRTRIELRKAHDLIVLKSLKPEEDIRQKFQAFPTSAIDPNLYQTAPAFNDILRSVGTQEANLGGTSGSTATESSIAESSRQSTLDSAIDELDDLLTEMARAGGQILLQEMSEEKVLEIVGPGAAWPDQTREETASEIHLEVIAGSSGRPNRAQEVQVRERVLPLLFQMPGLKHEQMAKDLLRVMDDSVHYEDWIDTGALPIIALNGQMQAAANRGEGDNGQGGASNAQKPPEPSNTGPARPGQDGSGATPVASKPGF